MEIMQCGEFVCRYWDLKVQVHGGLLTKLSDPKSHNGHMNASVVCNMYECTFLMDLIELKTTKKVQVLCIVNYL